ncbi:MAG: hypothetical protein ACOZF0_08370 [Thermodesulfobacteriota bacterium]
MEMTSDGSRFPAFFEEDGFDPVKTATGENRGRADRPGMEPAQSRQKNSIQEELSPAGKKKAGFYLSAELLERFNRKFHELKLAGVRIENKSALIEAALTFALDDMDRGFSSKVLQEIQNRGTTG